ncbi:hypothetical protein C1J03_15545 [Sulfitobacter sp. SK012]|uniref:hypothetical protein n=1 Tax=Sulfitobacter sp. SK012 TaxID=1389005 RepID=UPI000E0BD7A1|nr:hypothetical protein [Sulfitobacter sp. SK012]AXI47299.1 hypothetical protein C1J03_15545 [Sulfitobacter sp. SK012]
MTSQNGYQLFKQEDGVARWADAARQHTATLVRDRSIRSANLRHGDTWFVGVDLLPTTADGSIDGVALPGAWRAHVPKLPLHRAQVSIVYPGYPQQDRDETDANHRFRANRAAAHVDGLLPEGPERRRFAREWHAYILALPLTDCPASPVVVWRGSHIIMQRALVEAFGPNPSPDTDITQVYQAARREVFEQCEKIRLIMRPGEAALLHRFILHGTEPWDPTCNYSDPGGRMIAFFRPELPSFSEWLAPDAHL